MKKIFIGAAAILVMSMVTFSYSSGKIQKGDCMFKGKKLYGKVQIVDSFPDFKVKVTTSFPDLKVKMVTSFPDECGEWQMVEQLSRFQNSDRRQF